MARLTALSERSNIDALREFEEIRKKMAVMRSDEASLDTESVWESVRQSIDSVQDDNLNNARWAHSSHSQDQEPTSISQPVNTERQLVSMKEHNQTLQQRRSAIQKQFASLEASNYVVDAAVLVENPSKTGGRRFKQVSAEITEYYPGRVKLDTGSEADFVSLDYLLQAGFTQDALKSIPAAQQAQVVGINGAKYTPKFEIDLKWFRQGEALTNVGRFLVIDQAPFDILLSSKKFAPEAARQLVSLPLVRPRKPRSMLPSKILGALAS